MDDLVENGEEVRKPVVRPNQVATILSPEMYAEFATLADANERSIAAELRFAVKRHIQIQKQREAAA